MMPAPEEPGVIQLEVLVAVGRQHCKAVASVDPQFVVHCVDQAQDSVPVFREGGVVVTVVEPHLGSPPFHGGQEASVKDEFLHAIDLRDVGSAPVRSPARSTVGVLARETLGHVGRTFHDSAEVGERVGCVQPVFDVFVVGEFQRRDSRDLGWPSSTTTAS